MEKDDLIAQASLLVLELKIVHGPATFGLRQIGEEIVIVTRLGRFCDNDLRLAFVEMEGDVLVLLSKFQLLKPLHTIWVYGYTGRLVCKSNYRDVLRWQNRNVFVPSLLCVCVGSGGEGSEGRSHG